MAIDLKKPIGKGGKPAYTTKKGINLARDEQAEKAPLRLAIIGGVVVIAALCLVKFGVIDQNTKLLAAQNELASVQDTNLQLQQVTSRYGEVQIEYRTYSTEWADSDDSRFVSVPREDVLDLVETAVMPAGTVETLQISGETARLTMSDMTLEEISRMLLELQASPIVASATLNSAESVEVEATAAETAETDELETADDTEAVTPAPEAEEDSAAKVVFTITLELQKAEAEEDAQ